VAARMQMKAMQKTQETVYLIVTFWP